MTEHVTELEYTAAALWQPFCTCGWRGVMQDDSTAANWEAWDHAHPEDAES